MGAYISTYVTGSNQQVSLEVPSNDKPLEISDDRDRAHQITHENIEESEEADDGTLNIKESTHSCKDEIEKKSNIIEDELVFEKELTPPRNSSTQPKRVSTPESNMSNKSAIDDSNRSQPKLTKSPATPQGSIYTGSNGSTASSRGSAMLKAALNSPQHAKQKLSCSNSDSPNSNGVKMCKSSTYSITSSLATSNGDSDPIDKASTPTPLANDISNCNNREHQQEISPKCTNQSVRLPTPINNNSKRLRGCHTPSSSAKRRKLKSERVLFTDPVVSNHFEYEQVFYSIDFDTSKVTATPISKSNQLSTPADISKFPET